MFQFATWPARSPTEQRATSYGGTHLAVVDKAKRQGGHLGSKDHHDDHEELQTQRGANVTMGHLVCEVNGLR